MSEEGEIAEWGVELTRDGRTLVFEESSGTPIATVHGSEAEALQRARLIARAPGLRDGVRAAVQVFQAMYLYGDQRAKDTASDMLPALTSLLYGLEEPAAGEQ